MSSFQLFFDAAPQHTKSASLCHATPECSSPRAQGMANMGGGGPAPPAAEKDQTELWGFAFRSQLVMGVGQAP